MICQPDFDGFAEAYGRGEGQVVWTRLIDDLETPVSAYLKLAQGRPYAFLYESVEGGAWRGRYSIVAMNPDLVWRCFGDKAEVAQGPAIAAGAFTPEPLPALASLRALVAAVQMPLPPELPPMVSGLFGVLGYDMIRLFEPVGPAKPDTLGLPDAVMIRPSVVAVFDAIGQEIILSTTVRPASGVDARQAYDAAVARLAEIETDLRAALPPRKATQPHAQQPPESPVTRADYHRIVDIAKGYIAAGDIFQVVPSHRFRAPFPLDPFAFYRSLRRLNPAPFLFYLNFGNFQLAGSSPEILVRLRDGKVTIRPIAGTRPRGATPEQDAEYERELLADPKERAEHLMLLDLGRNDVGRAVMLNDDGRNAPVTGPRVKVTESFKIERYSTVMHIVSNVEGEAPEGLDPVDVILTALPAGTLSGAPKVRAMQIIDELETEKRGMAYAGAAGYISANGSVDTCIILRTALFKDGMMYVQGGGGVVADSDPDAEYEETRHKTRALRRAAEEAWRFGG
ncbi:MAG: anthranilate synthase component I [Caulobacterales bacterium 32-69-10]|nr:MAG: anthranilate synthase component I [Caulobacterales bacterium 32-69-10]